MTVWIYVLYVCMCVCMYVCLSVCLSLPLYPEQSFSYSLSFQWFSKNVFSLDDSRPLLGLTAAKAALCYMDSFSPFAFKMPKGKDQALEPSTGFPGSSWAIWPLRVSAFDAP